MATKRVSLGDRLRDEKRGVDALFSGTVSVDGQGDKGAGLDRPEYVRRTFHIRAEHVKAIRRFAYEQELDISEVVRRALDAYLPRY